MSASRDRRAHTLLATAAATSALLLAGCASPASAPTGPSDRAGDRAGPDPAPEPGRVSPSPTDPTAPDLPRGWRWESFGGVQVGVPGDWDWGYGTQRIGQWCIEDRELKAEPIVGRPGVSTLVACPGWGRGPDDPEPDPTTLLRNTGTVVAFDRAPGDPDGVEQEGDRTTVHMDGVMVMVQAPPDLRERIARTVHAVDVDAYGCAATHPVSEDAAWRPRPDDAVGVADLAGVTAVAACRYRLAPHPFGAEPRLLSSLRLEGGEAAAAVRRIAQAPEGGGPNAPDQCLAEVSYGDEAIVLRVDAAAGRSEIVLRYSGCDHNGLDDGVTVRALTADAVAPFVAGPNRPDGFSGPQQKADMLVR